MFKNILKLSLLAIITTLASCDVSDDGRYETTVLAPIVSANISETMQTGETYNIEVTYSKESNCHTFLRFDYQEDEDTFYVSAVARYVQESNCSTEATEEVEEIEFENDYEQDFVIKFVSGVNENNNAEYVEYEVEVTE